MPPMLDENRVEFIKDFIATYKSLPILWDVNHPLHNNRGARNEAWDVVVNKCKEYDDEANLDFARDEIDKLRSHFRRERRKILKERENGHKAAKPSLWFYNLLLFTVGAEDEASEDNINVNDPNDIWRRDRATMLMNQLKNYPCLYASDHPHYRKKVHMDAAYKAIAEYLSNETGLEFTASGVRYKIRLLRKLFNTERARILREEKQTGVKRPRLWCYESLKFLDKYCKTKGEENELEHLNGTTNNKFSEEMKKENAETSEADTETNDNSNENLMEDIYDTIGRNVTYKLRQMNDQQRQWAAKILNDVMYHGLMENLTDQSQLVLNNNKFENINK